MTEKPILIVEDDPDIRENLHMLLEGEGFSVLDASNGQQALDLLRSGTCSPALVFLDMMMPVMDGRTFLSELQSDHKFEGLPVMVITAAAYSIQDPKIVGFMKKPLDIDEVVLAATKYVRELS